MAIPKLFVFHSKTKKSIILLRSKFKCNWEMILWDREADTFTRGQWLCKKSIWPEGCSISPDGELFRCHYEIYTPEWGTYLVTSKVLNFTAIEGGFTQTNSGRWSVNYFEGSKGGPEEPPDGYSFLNGTILKGSQIIADFSEDTFVNKKPI